jgi:hypothetical protein
VSTSSGPTRTATSAGPRWSRWVRTTTACCSTRSPCQRSRSWMPSSTPTTSPSCTRPRTTWNRSPTSGCDRPGSLTPPSLPRCSACRRGCRSCSARCSGWSSAARRSPSSARTGSSDRSPQTWPPTPPETWSTCQRCGRRWRHAWTAPAAAAGTTRSWRRPSTRAAPTPGTGRGSRAPAGSTRDSAPSCARCGRRGKPRPVPRHRAEPARPRRRPARPRDRSAAHARAARPPLPPATEPPARALGRAVRRRGGRPGVGPDRQTAQRPVERDRARGLRCAPDAPCGHRRGARAAGRGAVPVEGAVGRGGRGADRRPRAVRAGRVARLADRPARGAAVGGLRDRARSRGNAG